MVLGNHDMALLCMAESFIEPQPGDTVQAVLAAPNATKILTWLRAQPLMIYNENAGFCVVHAGIWPLWNLSDCLKANDFIREALQGPQYHQVLRHLYGNAPTADNSTMPFLDRCRFITNAFTRMRYCDARGHLEFSEKNHPRDAPSGIIPWFSHPKRRPFHPTIFFGHWASLKGECAAHNIEALDTGCVWGGQLTAFRLEDQKRFSVQSTFPSHKDAE
jgi:bis(5'-nucleosyl)-tetraphosphatase (symmetrical)